MTRARDALATIRCNVPICGSPGAGKTALICQYASRGRDFPKQYKMTVGTELSVLDVQSPGGDIEIRLHLLDTGGHQAQLKLMQDSVGSSHNFCCLVYSVVDKETFTSIKGWYSMLAARASRQSKTLQGLLIGNKMDSPTGTHQVTSEMGDQLARQLGLTHIRISATKFGDSRMVFQAIAEYITEEYDRYLAKLQGV